MRSFVKIKNGNNGLIALFIAVFIVKSCLV